MYNQNNRLIRVEEGAAVLGEYFYDAFGRRVKKIASGVTTVFHYDAAGNLIAETKADGTPLRDIVYLNGGRVAMKLYGSQAGWYFFVNDHLGTPQKIVDSTGQVVWAGFYLPFGKAWAYPATITNNFRFPGQYYDAETGLHYNWHRYYDPDTGRYITADPIGLEGGVNLYAYVMGNPIKLTDPYGLSTGADVLTGIGWLLAAVEPTFVGEALMSYVTMIRAGIASAKAAEMIMSMSGKLSDPNPVPKAIREAYEDIITGNGTPRLDNNGCQKKYRADELKETSKSRNVWEGSLEWDVPGTNHRILQRADGKFGYVTGHDYAHPRLFPSPWY